MGRNANKPLNNRELSTFCEQMSMMLKAGISAAEGISILTENLENSGGKAILESISGTLDAGGSLYAALVKTGVFPRYFLDMTEIGERAGQLDEVFSSLAVYYDRQEALSKNIKSAVTYPCIMIGMMLVVILVLIIKVMPIFSQVYSQLGTEMNGISKGIMGIGAWLSRYSLIFLILAAVLLLTAVYLFRTKSGRRHLDSIGRRFPLTRRIYETTSLSRFADGMAITLKSGLDSDESLELSGKLTESPALRKKIEDCRKRTEDGADLGTAFRESGIFSGLYARMVSVGIFSGSLDQVMERVARQCAEESNDRISRAVSRLEPTLVAVMSILVGMILLSVMLPLMGIMTNIG